MQAGKQMPSSVQRTENHDEKTAMRTDRKSTWAELSDEHMAIARREQSKRSVLTVPTVLRPIADGKGSKLLL